MTHFFGGLMVVLSLKRFCEVTSTSPFQAQPHPRSISYSRHSDRREEFANISFRARLNNKLFFFGL
jgi:hypothetical protein